MANIASSKKDARRSAVRAARNRSIKSSVKTKVGRFRRAAAESAEDTEQLALTAVSALDRAVSKGVLHGKNAARRKSRLMKRLNASGVVEKAAAKPAPKAARSQKTPKTQKAEKPAAAPKRRTTRKASS